MRVFVFESITGGGMLRDSPIASLKGSLLAEGRAMLSAVAEDFARLADVEVVCLWNTQLPRPPLSNVQFVSVDSADSERDLFEHYASISDYTLLIAPELHGELLARTQRVERLGGRLLSPDSEFVRLTTSKYNTIRHLKRGGVRVPPTVLYRDYSASTIDFEPPLIVKPDDGAGSTNIQWLPEQNNELDVAGSDKHAFCVQMFCSGRPASVTVLCGRQRPILFPACWQDLQPPRFEYAGGSTILDPDLEARAAKLAQQVVETLPSTRGMIGVDLVLGDRSDGSADFAIEVNPRLTTSYVGIRCLAERNLARAMLAVAVGDEVTLTFRTDRIEFSASGQVRRQAALE